MEGLPPRVRARLETEQIAWLTTVSGDGVPSSSPVWFLLRNDDSIVVYSKDPSLRLRNLNENRHVNLHLEGNRRGGDVLALTGTAVADRHLPGPDEDAAYLAKYAESLDRNQWTPQWFAAHYPTPIVITTTSHIAW